MKIKNLVFSGGGLKGLAYLGAYQALKELEIMELQQIAGSSVGAIAGFFFILGYHPEELDGFITSFEFDKLKNFNFLSFFKNWGLESGDKVIRYLSGFLRKKTGKSDITFIDLYQWIPIKFTIVVTHLNRHQTLYLNHQNTPEHSVMSAIRKSISIPLIFQPVIEDGQVYIDGGLLDNFPILQVPDSSETLGLYFSETEPDHQIAQFESYISHTFSSMFNLNIRKSIAKIEKSHLIFLDPDDCSGVNLYMKPEIRRKLYDNGYNAVKDYFSPSEKKIDEESQINSDKDPAC